MSTIDRITAPWLRTIRKWPTWHSVVYRHDLLRELIGREMKVRYRHAILGSVWSMINPLLTGAVLVFVFGAVFDISTMVNYPLYVFSGLLVYGWSQDAITQAASAITANPELTRRPGFSPAVLPLVNVMTSLVHFMLSVPVLVFFLMFVGIGLHSTIILLPFVIIVQFILTLGLAYPVASMNVFFRDTQYLVGVLLMLIFFLTPIFYSVENVPPASRPLYNLNPFVQIVTAYRAILLHGIVPDWNALVWPLSLGLVLLVFGTYLFDRTRHRFVEEL